MPLQVCLHQAGMQALFCISKFPNPRVFVHTHHAHDTVLAEFISKMESQPSATILTLHCGRSRSVLLLHVHFHNFEIVAEYMGGTHFHSPVIFDKVERIRETLTVVSHELVSYDNRRPTGIEGHGSPGHESIVES